MKNKEKPESILETQVLTALENTCLKGGNAAEDNLTTKCKCKCKCKEEAAS